MFASCGFDGADREGIELYFFIQRIQRDVIGVTIAVRSCNDDPAIIHIYFVNKIVQCGIPNSIVKKERFRIVELIEICLNAVLILQ